MERYIQVQRTARYHLLGVEDGPVRETWFVLHGYQQLAGRFINRFRTLDDGTRRIVAPEALSRFYVSQEPGRHGPASKVGATWMTREDRDHEIQDYVSYLDTLAEYVADGGEHAGRTTVLGFSQGVATAARWVTLGTMRPARLILWGDQVPPDLDLDRAAASLEGVDVVLARGRRDRIFQDGGASMDVDRLRSAGISCRVAEYDGGHDVDQRLLKELAETPV